MAEETELHKRKSSAQLVKKADKPEEGEEGLAWQLNQQNISELQRRQQEIGQRVFKKAIKRFAFLAIALVTVYVYKQFTQEPVNVFASARDHLIKAPVSRLLACSVQDYRQDSQRFPACVPTKCGRVVTDGLVTPTEAKLLLDIAKKGFALTQSNGSASILDLHSGAISDGQQFVNVYHLMEVKQQKVLTPSDFDIYRQVKNKIHAFISSTFNVPKDQLYLTHPTFFSKLTAQQANNVHDQYWHAHIDKRGRFMFVDHPTNSSIEPRAGRVSVFTSGAENLHFVEKVKQGHRYAITISFTCDPEFAIQDPSPKSHSTKP